MCGNSRHWFCRAVQSIVEQTLVLEKHQRGLFDVVSFSDTITLMTSLLQSFDSINDDLASEPSPNGDYDGWWTVDTSTAVVYLENAHVLVKNMTRSNLVSEFVSSVQVVLSLPVANCTMANRFVFFVVTNADVMHDMFEASATMRYEELHTFYSQSTNMVRCRARRPHRAVVV